MSAFAAEAERAHDQSLSHNSNAFGVPSDTQEHDNKSPQDPSTGDSSRPMGSDKDVPVEVTALQRMSSATLGSIITSLLGMYPVYTRYCFDV